MSGQSGGGQTQGGQGGQSQGQGGQPQGQGGQRQGQGGQPQGGQPQGQRGQRSQGGAPGGGTAPMGGGGGGGADTTIIQEWAIFGTIMFALSGVGAGVLAFLIDAIDQPVVELDLGGAAGGGNEGFSAVQQLQQAGGGTSGANIALGGLDVLPVLAVFLAPFIGLVIAKQVSLDDNTTFQAVGAATGVGTLVFLILGWFIMSLALPSSLSIAFGGIIINAIISAIIAALVAIGGVWTQRNQSPTM